MIISFRVLERAIERDDETNFYCAIVVAILKKSIVRLGAMMLTNSIVRSITMMFAELMRSSILVMSAPGAALIPARLVAQQQHSCVSLSGTSCRSAGQSANLLYHLCLPTPDRPHIQESDGPRSRYWGVSMQ
jgi:hypothetical protein